MKIYMSAVKFQTSPIITEAGICILIIGNTAIEQNIVVTSQSVPAGNVVNLGTVVELRFTDIKVRE